MIELPKPTPPCSCSYCVGCCSHKPGMFLPGEPERLAKHLGVGLDVLFKTSLAVDVVHDIDKDSYTLLPATVETKNAGGMYRNGEGGTCVFLKGGRCSVNEFKPFECKVTDHVSQHGRRDEAAWARRWRRRKATIERLVGRELPDRAIVGIRGWNRPRFKPNVSMLRDLKPACNGCEKTTGDGSKEPVRVVHERECPYYRQDVSQEGGSG